MKKLLLILALISSTVSAQNISAYIKANAVKIDNVELLSDSLYKLVSPFKLIMVGEMHGSKGPAEFVTGLAKLFSVKGDSVSVGLEIPPDQMSNYLLSHTDSSIYQSKFFSDPSFLSGRESFTWARVISSLKNNPWVQ